MSEYYVSCAHEGKRIGEYVTSNDMEVAFKYGKEHIKEKYKIDGSAWSIWSDQK